MKSLIIPDIIREKCPIWTERLETQDLEQLQDYDRKTGGATTAISSSYICIVGEAYNFTTDYCHEERGCRNPKYCQECSDIAFEFQYAIEERQVKFKYYDLQDTLFKFADHLLAAHTNEQKITIEKELLEIPLVMVK